ncbi:MAG TPA: hypothetical protein VKM94_21450 [Blastocatellia bacterium]|nr:hypothetical protein [Blastocatellia bacterium]
MSCEVVNPATKATLAGQAVAGSLTAVVSTDLKSIRVLVKCILPKGTG